MTIEAVARLSPPRASLVSRFHPLNPMRMLWLRKRRRLRRRRRQSRRRRPRSNVQARVEPQLRPGIRFLTKRFCYSGGPWARLFDSGRDIPIRHCLRQTRSVCARERLRRSNPASFRSEKEAGLLRGACHRAALRADPLARNDGFGGSGNHRSASASRAPSAAKPAAKPRRSQVITLGRVTIRSRTEAANRP